MELYYRMKNFRSIRWRQANDLLHHVLLPGKAVKVILEAGITLEVFGDSWKKSPFGDSPYLRIHEAVDMRESLEVMEKALYLLM